MRTPTNWPSEQIADGLRHLQTEDLTLARVIDKVGPFSLRLQSNRFQMLVRSIIAQQISSSAAQSIYKRLKKEVAPAPLNPETFIRLDMECYRNAGVSPQKRNYLQDLAQKTIDRTVPMHRLSRLPNDEIIEHLIQVKGIGVWTAQMFLIFSLGRLDVFPYDDFGIRTALKRLYGFAELPNKAESLNIGSRWRPYATIASWYCWRSLDLQSDRNRNPF